MQLPFFNGPPIGRQFLNPLAKQGVVINLQGTHENFQVELPSTSSFGDVRTQVARMEEVPREMISLTFKGRHRSDEDLLLHYGVKQGSVVKFEVHPRAPPAAHQPFASHPGQAPAHQGSYAAAAAATPQYPKANASHKRGSHRASQQHHVPEQIRVHDHHSAVPAQQKTSNIDQAGWASFSPPESSRRPTSKPSPAARPSTPSNQKRSEPIGNDAIQQSPETVASLKAIQTVEKEVDALTSQIQPGLETKAAAMLKEQLTQRLLVLDGIQVTGETRPLRKALINRIDKSCDVLQTMECAPVQEA